MTALTEALDDLTQALPRAAALIHLADADGTTTRGQPGSSPPWNSQVAHAVLDATEGAAQLEQALRLEVTGRTGMRRAPSATGTVIRLIAIHGGSLTSRDAQQVTRQVVSWVQQLLMLPAIDEEERPIRLTGVLCPYCEYASLRAYVRSGRVACLRYGACLDLNGDPPRGQMMISRVTSDPVVSWSDGLVT